MAETQICNNCKLPGEPTRSGCHADSLDCLKAMEKAMTALLTHVGQLGTCRGCNAPVVWVTHRNGKHVPYTMEGLNHFVDCPARTEFKGKK